MPLLHCEGGMCSLRDHRWEGRKQEGQVLTLGWGLGTRLAEAASLPNPAGPGNVGLENVRLNSGPSPNSSPLVGEEPFLGHTPSTSPGPLGREWGGGAGNKQRKGTAFCLYSLFPPSSCWVTRHLIIDIWYCSEFQMS